MRNFILGFLLLICGFAFGQYKISGQVVDQNNVPLEGCHIHIGSKNTLSSTKGFYLINNIPEGTVTILISSMGYTDIEEILLVKNDLVRNYKLVVKLTKLREVSVNKKRNTENNSILEQKIKGETIERYSSQSLGDALKEVAGVSVLRTGSTIVKPVINGLHSNRVPIISNNVRLEDQEWGSEHAPNFDINAAGKITVIKGASGLQYGGDAVGGLVVIEAINVKKDTLFGKTITTLNSNGRGGAISSSLHKGNFCDWSWNTAGTFKYFGDRTAPNYVLSNSGNRELNFYGDVKFTRKKYDLAMFYSIYNAQIGIVRASHIGNVTDLYNAINFQIPAVVNDFTYSINNPKQEVAHHLAKVNFNYHFDETATLSFQYSFQFNKRLEFDVRRTRLLNDIPALDLELFTNTLKIDYKKEYENLTLKTGLNVDYQNNIASPETGIRPLIPNYVKKDIGIYAISTYNVDKDLTIDFGLRYDFSNIDATKFYFKTRWNERGYNNLFNDFIVGETPLGDQWRTNPKFTFHNVSGSLGFHKVFNETLNWFMNVSLATRNPNPSEFFSDGLHHSTGRIELGDLSLQKEQSYKFSTTIQQKWQQFSIEINPYINRINNFMFLQPSNPGFERTTRGAFPVWDYKQTNALLTGIDISSNWDISKHWKHHFLFATVNGKDLSKNLPLIAVPPTTFTNKIQFYHEAFHRLKIGLQNEVVFRQTQFPNNNFVTQIIRNNELLDVEVDISSPPSAYQLWNFDSEMKFDTFHKTSTTIGFSIQNILNTNYRDYLNNQRFFVNELGRNFQIQVKINY